MKYDLKKNIALIGFMATGKSTIGKTLADKMEKKFIEMDILIEKKAGKGIPSIFKEDGEIRFRELEMSVCKDLSSVEGCVISTGGGVIMNKLNIDYLKLSSDLILLEASPETIFKRAMQEGKEERPMIDKPDPKKEILQLLEYRQPFYHAATEKRIQTDNLSIGEIVEHIIELHRTG